MHAGLCRSRVALVWTVVHLVRFAPARPPNEDRANVLSELNTYLLPRPTVSTFLVRREYAKACEATKESLIPTSNPAVAHSKSRTVGTP